MLRRYWWSLVPPTDESDSVLEPRGREGYTFGQRYWASLLGITLDPSHVDGRSRVHDIRRTRGMLGGEEDPTTVVRVRVGIGIIGLLLPFAIPLAVVITTLHEHGNGLPGSMSASYYTHARNIFVGGMCAIGVFLIGYRRSQLDNWMSNLAGVLSLGVALFPTSKPGAADSGSWTAHLHTASAIGLLITLGLFCLWRFPRGTDRAQLLSKQTSDRIYIGCGIGMGLCGVLGVLDQFGVLAFWTLWPTPLYVAEAGSVLLFGIAWLIKGWNLGRALAIGSVPLAPATADRGANRRQGPTPVEPLAAVRGSDRVAEIDS